MSEEDVAIIGINNTSSANWLQVYAGQRAISYPFIFDGASDLFNLFEVGAAYRNVPPTYIIIDQNGIIQYRIDDTFYKIDEMKEKIEELL
jgi:peroxiredoxin